MTRSRELQLTRCFKSANRSGTAAAKTDYRPDGSQWKYGGLLLKTRPLCPEEPNVELFQANNMLASDGTSLILPAAKIEQNLEDTNLELDGFGCLLNRASSSDS